MKYIALHRGFTIVELIITVSIIAILGTIIGISYNGVQQSARDNGATSDAEALDAIQTQYSLKNAAAGKAWYSEAGADPDINFTPSGDNIVDIVVDSTDYCIRVYNPRGATYTSIDTAATRESSEGACDRLIPSLAAGGTIAAPGSINVVSPGILIQLDVSWAAVAAAATYRIEYSTSPTFATSTFINGVTGTSASFVPSPPAGSTLHYVRVYSVSSSGVVSPPSPTGSATTGVVMPA